MKNLGSFILVAISVLAVFAQSTYAVSDDDVDKAFYEGSEGARQTFRIIKKYSDENYYYVVFVNATHGLEDSYNEGLIPISRSENIIKNTISKAKELVLQDPAAANDLVRQGCEDARSQIVKSGPPFFKAYGEAVVRSNNGSKSRLETASVFVQKAGISILDQINLAENVSEEGLSTGGRPAQVLLEAILLAVEAGYSCVFNNIQKSIEEADKALRDAESKPMQGEVEDPNCKAGKNDREASDAINDINKAANNALQRGANADLVKRFKEALICTLGGLVVDSKEAQSTLYDLETIAEYDTIATKITFFELAEHFKEVIHNFASKFYTIFGDVALRSGNQLNTKIAEALTAFENGKDQNFLATKTAEDTVDIGLRYSGYAARLAVRAASEIFNYGKIASIQGIVKSAKIVFSVL